MIPVVIFYRESSITLSRILYDILVSGVCVLQLFLESLSWSQDLVSRALVFCSRKPFSFLLHCVSVKKISVEDWSTFG